MIGETLALVAERAAAAPPLVTLVLVFLGGVLSSASPCVLAAVPLVVAAVGGAATSRRRAVALSFAFVLGLALCFTVLGAVAALTGSLIGDVGEWWKVVLAAVLIVMGLHLSGLVRIPFPTVETTRFRRAGVVGAFALGALTGTLSSPCATPILVVVLSLVAFEGRVWWGTSLLAVYALGHVVLLFLAGAASGFAAAYLGSRAVVWAARFQRSLGVVMFGAGIWILAPLALRAATP